MTPDERLRELGTVDRRQHRTALGRTDHWFDRILVGVIVLLAIAVAFLFVAAT